MNGSASISSRIAEKVQSVVDHAPLGTSVSVVEGADGGRYIHLVCGGAGGKNPISGTGKVEARSAVL